MRGEPGHEVGYVGLLDDQLGKWIASEEHEDCSQHLFPL